MTPAVASEKFHSVYVDASHAGMRLEAFVRRIAPALSRRAVQQAIEEGWVLVDGRRAAKGTRLQTGMAVSLAENLLMVRELQPNPDLPVRVLFEDDDLVAVDKPAGIPSHALRPFERNTVANFLLARYPEMRSLSRAGLEAGLVHRLDTDTSGVLLAARNSEVHRRLRQQFAAQEVRKQYWALVAGQVTEAGVVRHALERDPHRPEKMRTAPLAPAGRDAVTYYRPLECYSQFTLLRLDIYSGVRHQIRAHLAALGHPIAGDTLYGGPAVGGLSRQFLHAVRVSLPHPVTAKPLTVESALPEDLSRVLHELRRHERALAWAARPRRRRRNA